MRVPANAGFEFGAFRLPVGLSRVPSRLRIAPMINDTGGGDSLTEVKIILTSASSYYHPAL